MANLVEIMPGGPPSDSILATSAFGSESTRISHLVAESRSRQKETIEGATRSEEMFQMVNRVFRVCKEADKPDWDGNGGKPITPNVLRDAFEFLQLLPRTANEPDIFPDPSGGICLEWYDSAARNFTVCLLGNGRTIFLGTGISNTVRGETTIREGYSQVLLPNFENVMERPLGR